ncbi:uncharacterized protein LOC134210565 [Armigeres subalbatus]|uniref:uncharacterized protein LOC134210565 n=1 Tax=Armigeres subalbatus TaxID=124917 RepID=UPI002ED0D405
MPVESGSRFSPITRLYVFSSVLSIALNATFFGYVLYADKLYDIGKCWSSWVLMLLPVIELLKHYYVRSAFRLDGSAKSTTSGIGSGAGSSSRVGSSNLPKRPSPVKELGGALMVFLLAMLFYGFICLILGAPLEQYEETASLALVLTTLTIFPVILFIGHSETLQLLFTETLELRTALANGYLTLLKNNCIGVVLGAWGASVVAPLDWDRPWQVYPVPNVVGAIGGAFGMSFYTLLSTTYFAFCKAGRKRGIV